MWVYPQDVGAQQFVGGHFTSPVSAAFVVTHTNPPIVSANAHININAFFVTGIHLPSWIVRKLSQKIRQGGADVNRF